MAAWLNELDYDDWDRKMMEDFAPGGRGMALVEKLKCDIADGKAVLFEEGWRSLKPSKTGRAGEFHAQGTPIILAYLRRLSRALHPTGK